MLLDFKDLIILDKRLQGNTNSFQSQLNFSLEEDQISLDQVSLIQVSLFHVLLIRISFYPLL